MPISPFRRRSSNSADAADDDAEPMDATAAAHSREELASSALDCYPYTFSPLLLFAQDGYFDQGYSNYNSVASFFSSIHEGAMLQNVLYERKNMLYEELLEYVTANRMLVTCCIDSHFTAFQVVGPHALIHYDPLKPWLTFVNQAEGYRRFVLFLLMKCNYGDNTHVQENKNHYTGQQSNPTRRVIYELWRNINKMSDARVSGRSVGLSLGRYVLVNDPKDPRRMSCQLTGNTCYFQVYLFGVLCKVGEPRMCNDESEVELMKADDLEATSARMCELLLQASARLFLSSCACLPLSLSLPACWASSSALPLPLPLQFFVDDHAGVMRPLTNSNVICDFYRFEEAPYYATVTRYLRTLGVEVPEYEQQYTRLLGYFNSARLLHTYSLFREDGAMGSVANTKQLQYVCDTDGAGACLAHSQYYKYRAVQLGFGFNTNITGDQLGCFAEFNALRKNQLLGHYEEIAPLVAATMKSQRTTNKYRDYYFMPMFEVGQRELIELHHYTYEIDMCALMDKKPDKAMVARVRAVNAALAEKVLFSTSRTSDYDKLLSHAQFCASRFYEDFLSSFMSIAFFEEYAQLPRTFLPPSWKLA